MCIRDSYKSVPRRLKLPIKRYIAVDIDNDGYNCLRKNCGSDIEDIVRIKDVRSEAEIACAVGKDTIDATPRALNFDGGYGRDAVPGTAPARWREGRRSSRDLVLGPTPARWRGSWRRLASSRSPLDATQVFCAGSPCDGISGNNRYRKASIVDTRHPGWFPSLVNGTRSSRPAPNSRTSPSSLS